MKKKEILELKLSDIRIDQMLNNDSAERKECIHLSAKQYIGEKDYQCWITHQINGLDTVLAFKELELKARTAFNLFTKEQSDEK